MDVWWLREREQVMSLRCRPRNSIAEVYKQREFEVEGATMLKSLRRARQPATRGRTVERIQASAWRRFRMTAVAVAATSLNVLSVVYVSRWRRRRPAPWGARLHGVDADCLSLRGIPSIRVVS